MRHVTDSHDYDVVYTPFMLRVRDALDGAGSAPDAPQLRPSELHPRANVIDTWFYLRARGEQVIAEANAMLEERAPLIDLEDESGTGRLAFVIRHGARWARLRVDEVGRQAFIELERWESPTAGPVEPTDQTVLEDLVLSLLDLSPTERKHHE